MVVLGLLLSPLVSGQDTEAVSGVMRTAQAIDFIFIGSLLLIFLVNIISFGYSRRAEYFWYSLYGFLLVIYFGSKTLHSFDSIFSHQQLMYVDRLSQPLFLYAYCEFMRSFLESKVRHPSVDRLLVIFKWGMLASAISMLALIFLQLGSAMTMLWYGYRAGAAIFSLYIIILLFRIDRKTYTSVYFMLYGSLALIIGSLLAMILSIYFVMIGPIAPLHWMAFGILIELGIFSAGMGYKLQEINRDKITAQKALILQMQANEKLSQAQNDNLRKKIELAREQIQIEERQKAVAESSFKERDTELQLLRTQMNPHFIFNSLNSVKAYIIKNNPRVAGDYLSKFASLMRRILANSKELTVSLQQELDTINTYIELEQMRFDGSFDYTLNVDDTIDPNSLHVLPLLLQPFVENAIWHGLLHADHRGKITIAISCTHNLLSITIDDNGIGRKLASQKKNTKDPQRKSYGVQISTDRIKQYYGDQASIQLIDKADNAGTTVVLNTPLKKDLNYAT